VSPHPVSVSPIYTQTHRDTGIESVYVTDRFAIQFKTVRHLIMSEDLSRIHDEVKDDAHGTFTPEMTKLPQAIWIETFVDGVTDKSTGLPIFKEFVRVVYEVSGVMCSESVYENCRSIDGWIHSNRKK
jgi:hypothetical protein